jgi:hypothetical protein
MRKDTLCSHSFLSLQTVFYFCSILCFHVTFLLLACSWCRCAPNISYILMLMRATGAFRNRMQHTGSYNVTVTHVKCDYSYIYCSSIQMNEMMRQTQRECYGWWFSSASQYTGGWRRLASPVPALPASVNHQADKRCYKNYYIPITDVVICSNNYDLANTAVAESTKEWALTARNLGSWVPFPLEIRLFPEFSCIVLSFGRQKPYDGCWLLQGVLPNV